METVQPSAISSILTPAIHIVPPDLTSTPNSRPEREFNSPLAANNLKRKGRESTADELSESDCDQGAESDKNSEDEFSEHSIVNIVRADILAERPRQLVLPRDGFALAKKWLSMVRSDQSVLSTIKQSGDSRMLPRRSGADASQFKRQRNHSEGCDNTHQSFQPIPGTYPSGSLRPSSTSRDSKAVSTRSDGGRAGEATGSRQRYRPGAWPTENDEDFDGEAIAEDSGLSHAACESCEDLMNSRELALDAQIIAPTGSEYFVLCHSDDDLVQSMSDHLHTDSNIIEGTSSYIVEDEYEYVENSDFRKDLNVFFDSGSGSQSTSYPVADNDTSQDYDECFLESEWDGYQIISADDRK
ncbi:uncharacterized protein V1518DRAFT_410608 [Limtongia smithiae]|uniref:uncharacterized protein n=1 Tax=Limtongia smithiae TaxID=1125753 RepID=UPI0034CDDF7A